MKIELEGYLLPKSSKFYSEAGKKGAENFWRKFYNDPQFQEKMRNSWRGHRVNHEKIVEAAKLGYIAFKKRYSNDIEFKRKMDEKLAVSRSKGGSNSLKNLEKKASKNVSRK
jgi:hypothetical protein